MSLELVPSQPAEILDPTTGELVPLDGPTDRLAQVLDDVRELERQLRTLKSVVSGELLERMDRSAQWTLREGSYEISGASPSPTLVYDADRLYGVLRGLVDDGVIAPAAAEAAVRQVVELKPVVRGINALRKLGGQVALEIEACAAEVEKDRRVSVKKTGA